MNRDDKKRIFDAIRDIATKICRDGEIYLRVDLIDVFNRSYIANLNFITGYINDDKTVIHEVKKKATWSAIFIVILYVIINFIVM